MKERFWSEIVSPPYVHGIQPLREWSRVKHDIIAKYIWAYNKVLKSGRHRGFFKTMYVDAFAGADAFYDPETYELVSGSPTRALTCEHPFDIYCFIDLDGSKATRLARQYQNRSDVKIAHADCNRVLLERVIPYVGASPARRAVVVLDPYGLHLDWKVIEAAGRTKRIELFINYPVMDINRNACRRVFSKLEPGHIDRMNKFWGDTSWIDVVYSDVENLFGETDKVRNHAAVFRLANAYGRRLRDVAGFKNLSNPAEMRIGGNRGATLYYLFHCAQLPLATNIVNQITKNYPVANKRVVV